MGRLIRWPFAGLVSGLLASAPIGAQLPIPTLGIAGGVSQFDMSGTGTAPFGALRLDLPISALILEGSVGAFRTNEQFDAHRTYIVPEGQLQIQLFPMYIRPYVGVGGGWVRAISGTEPRRNDMTMSASAGIRAGLPALPFSIRAELRVRGIGSGFTGSAAEWTIGLSK